MSRYTVVTDAGGDWVCLYGPDGRLLDEGHSLNERRALDALGIAYDEREVDFEAECLGRGTERLDDMPRSV